MNSLRRQLPVNNVNLIQKRFLRPYVNTSQLKEGRRTGALAMKVGMLPFWDKWGERYAVTVLHVDDCRVLQVKLQKTEGYCALQLGVGNRKESRTKGTIAGQCRKAGVDIKRNIQEFRVSEDSVIPVGTQIRALHFVPGQIVDVCGTSKGKGFAGVMKRWNFGGGRASHGNSLAHRIPGSTGCRQDPGRVFKNKKMPGRLGGDRITTQNLQVLKIDPIRDLLYIKGAVPGPTGNFVRITDAVKGPFYPTPPPMPTFLIPSSDPAFPAAPLFAPVGDVDKLDFKEPDDPY